MYEANTTARCVCAPFPKNVTTNDDTRPLLIVSRHGPYTIIGYIHFVLFRGDHSASETKIRRARFKIFLKFVALGS